jgi:two-component system chemotaxis response regulator CheY
MRALVVDDNKSNRLILKLLLTEFGGFDNIAIAEDGLEAVQKHKDSKFDIIFMDIMMPNMNGIEATKEIRQFDKNALIVAVSALDDDNNKKEILSCGAEDYITKPINSDIFNSRVKNYVKLIESRHISAKKSDDAINLFDKNVYTRFIIFKSENESQLAEFWEYYLINTVSDSPDDLIDIIRTIYDIGLYLLDIKNKFRIVVEESEEYFYFSIKDKSDISIDIAKKIVDTINKNYSHIIYEIDDTTISFSLKKLKKVITTPKETKVETIKTLAEPQAINTQEEIVATTIEHTPMVLEKHELVIYDFLEHDDITELEDYIQELNSTLLMLQNSELTQEDILVASGYIGRFAKILSTYPETFNISSSMRSLSEGIRSNMDSFREKAKDLAPMLKAFNNDLSTWVRMTFYDGIPSIDYMDNSIISNANTMLSFISPEELGDSNLDDIFDF